MNIVKYVKCGRVKCIGYKGNFSFVAVCLSSFQSLCYILQIRLDFEVYKPLAGHLCRPVEVSLFERKAIESNFACLHKTKLNRRFYLEMLACLIYTVVKRSANLSQILGLSAIW